MDTSSSPGNSSGSAAESARQAGSDLANTAKTQAAELAETAKHSATEQLSEGKDKASSVLSDVAEALHQTGDSLRDHDQGAFARYADTAARQVEQFTEAIRGRSVGELLDEAEAFARRDPGLFLGGAFMLGIFGSRFLKASGSMGSGVSSQSRQSGGSVGTRSLLSGLSMPGGPGREHVTNVNRPDVDLSGSGQAGSGLEGSGMTSAGRGLGTSAGQNLAGASRGAAFQGSFSGADLPASSPAAAGSSSMGTALGTGTARSGSGSDRRSDDARRS